MDILSFLGEAYSNLAYNLPAHIYSFLFRANLLLLCPTAVAYIGFSQGVRSQKTQVILMIVGLVIGLNLPIHRLLSPSPFKPWITVILLAGLWYLPVPLSFLVHPVLGVQTKVLKYTRIAIAALFVLNILIWR